MKVCKEDKAKIVFLKFLINLKKVQKVFPNTENYHKIQIKTQYTIEKNKNKCINKTKQL